jgi:septal ring factor EnvC (AmiA/AmiB activator)
MTPDEDDDFGFDRSEKDAEIRELEATVVRLEAQLDQLAAEYREHRAELDLLRAQVDVLDQTVTELTARRRRREGPLFFFWAVVWGALGAVAANLLVR